MGHVLWNHARATHTPDFVLLSTRRAESVERIVATVIEQVYLTRQRNSMQKVVTDILARCRAGGIEAPHPNTIRRRIARITRTG